MSPHQISGDKQKDDQDPADETLDEQIERAKDEGMVEVPGDSATTDLDDDKEADSARRD